MANPNPTPPPEETRWKKGQSGNPNGKPKGSKHISTHIQEMLNDPDFELKLKDGKILKGRPMDAILQTAIAKAVSGDMRAFDMLGKYGYGTKLDITSEGEKIQPILGGLSDLHSDDSDSQDSESKE